ncbi:hypothetical protein BS78_08G127600 [Paspalum vaginatum]|nr:hypothetical protein BS78_08G127600 [Paspalum vaginatum]
MDSSADGEKNSDETSLPEWWFNVAILFSAFLYKAMNGLGILATIWATVVLLGGFSILVKQTDFWILGGYEDTAHQIFMRAPGVLMQDWDTGYWQEQFGWWRHRRMLQQPRGILRSIMRTSRQEPTRMSRQELLKRRQEVRGLRDHIFRNFLGGFIDMALVLGQVAAAATCMILSWRRLKKHDYVEAENLYRDDHRNISRSLTIFYGLVLAQGFIFILMRLNPVVPYSRMRTQHEYKLFWPWSKIIFRYMDDSYLELITGNVRVTLNMDLVTYAKNLVACNSLDDQLLGLRSMHRILSPLKYRSLVLTRLRSSLDTEALGKLVNMLGFSGTRMGQDIRGHAARVVLRLAPHLVVGTCPGNGILHLISSSLLNNPTPSSNKEIAEADPDLVWFGLRILDKLTDNPENCKEANKDGGHLLPKIIDLITDLCSQGYSSGTLSDSWVEHEIILPLVQQEEDIPLPSKMKIDQEIIVAMSLNILSKLVAAPGASEFLGREISSKYFNFLATPGMISKHVGAARVISCAAVAANKAREEIGMLPGVLKNLKDCLLVLSKAPYVNISKVAAKLLLLEYTSSDHLDHIQLFIDENRIIEDQRLQLPVSAFIQELDLDELSMPLMQSKVQRLDLEDLLSASTVNHCEEAAKALFLLTTDCEDNVAAFLREISIEDLEKIVNLLSPEDEDKERRRMLAHFEGRHLQPEILRVIKKMFCAEGEELKRSMHAKLLQNLRAYSRGDFDGHMKVIDEALPMVFKAILDEVAILEDPSSTDENLCRVKDDLWIKGGKVLESFVGLAVQICRSMDTSMFAEKLCDAKLNVDIRVKKLKKILELYKSPTTEFPYIRRYTLELLIWMVENNNSNIEVLLQCGMYEQLHEVEETARKLESFKLFHCEDGVPAGSGIPHISTLAATLRKKLQLSPCFKERSSSISVIII